MKNLQLSLKKRWFDLTKSGIKTEDYREITPYWATILLTYWGEKKNKEFWGTKIVFHGSNFQLNRMVESIKFDSNIMTLGYPKSEDSERILKLEHKGIEIRTGKPEWGAEPNKLYFVIMHGSSKL